MNLDDLRSAQVEERGTDSLQPLRSKFYEEAATYLADLRDRRDRLADRADDPFDSEEVRQLTDELETAEEVVEAIYERRVGKLVKQASLAAAGMPADEAGLTEEERALYTDLVDRIEANRATVLETLEGDGSVSAVDQPAPEQESAPEPPADTPDAAEVMGDEETEAEALDETPVEPETDPQPEPDGGSTAVTPEETPDGPVDDTDRLTVRITAAVGEIYGVDDRVYTLDAEDVVTLPEPNARPLLERGAAQRVE